jgi:hypothetical protein
MEAMSAIAANTNGSILSRKETTMNRKMIKLVLTFLICLSFIPFTMSEATSKEKTLVIGHGGEASSLICLAVECERPRFAGGVGRREENINSHTQTVGNG